MDQEKLKALVAKREALESQINKLEDEWNDVHHEICDIAGPCIHCRNSHYPHCRTEAAR